MKVAIAYTVVSQGPLTAEYCARFVATWHEYPPGFDHDTFLICNGGPVGYETSLQFADLRAKMFPRANDPGWDITGYIDAAKGPCAGYDMILCLGESNYFHRAGWLLRLVEAWTKHGPGFYGPFSSHAIRAHLNTTAFCCPPLLLQQYQAPVNDRPARYEFEYGEKSLWRRTRDRGMPVRLVTWDGDYPAPMWRTPPNILWRGDQKNLLMWCNHSDGYFHADNETKREWARRCDQIYR